MEFSTYKIEIYWQVVILILDFLALACELNHIFFALLIPAFTPGFRIDRVAWTLSRVRQDKAVWEIGWTVI